MRHLRRDYDVIQDCAQVIETGAGAQYIHSKPTSIAPDEPVFILRAKDVTAPDTVRYWASVQRDRHLAAALQAWAIEMEHWQMAHPERVKFPDAPPDALRYDPFKGGITP